jgi:hypothetical protein
MKLRTMAKWFSLTKETIMQDNQSGDLYLRIARLEHESRRWRIVAIGALFVPFLLMGLGATPRGDAAASLEAREFVLVDADGRALIRLGRDAETRARAVLEFLDREGERRIAIGVENNGAPSMSLTDAADGDELRLDVQPRDGSAVAFRNTRNRSGLLLAAGPPGVAAIGFMDKEGKHLIEIGVNPDDKARLTINSKDGKKLYEVP